MSREVNQSIRFHIPVADVADVYEDLSDQIRFSTHTKRSAFIWQCPITGAEVDGCRFENEILFVGRAGRDGSPVDEFISFKNLFYSR